jgi:glyoxylase-like metal-dependent hydrolase (beta-lactamase superfamily II)
MPELAEITYEARRVKGGDKLHMGEVTLEFVPAPGHRPEQLCLLITDHSRSDEPWCMLTADFLLVGDIARPDLAQAGLEGAEIMFDKALPVLHSLPDYVEVYPGHVSGST